MMDEEAIRNLVTRLSRQHSSGGAVIERAAVLAEGAESKAILAWIADHDGEPEPLVVKKAAGGLHTARLGGSRGGGEVGAVADFRTARRYVLPPGTLT
jgi:hypothetical protein